MSEIFNPSSAIYTPNQVADIGVRSIEQTEEYSKSDAGIGIPIQGICDYFPPLLPGQVCGVTAQTSNYKTGFLDFIETEAAKKITERGDTNKIIVHVSMEELIEDQAYLQLGMKSGDNAGDLAQGKVINWDVLRDSAIKVGNIPIYRIGSSMARAEDMPNLYMSNIFRAIQYLNEELLDWKPKIAGLFLDYLQAFPIDPEIKQSARTEQRRLQVRSDMFRIKQAAAYFKCPIYVGIQAKQELNGANPPIMLPGVYDGEESSSIAQRLNRIITLWMPKMTNLVGSLVDNRNGLSFVVKENTLFIKVAKQQGRLPSGKSWMCDIDFTQNYISLAKPPRVENFKTIKLNELD